MANESTRFGRIYSKWPHLLILILGIALYAPFASKTLYHLDSVGFALSIHHFSLRLHQPHAPGYPLYVLALRTVKWVTGAPDVSCIVIVSIAATVISAILFYALVESLSIPEPGSLFAILLLTSPVVWFNAEIPFSYPVGLLSSVAVALVALRLTQGSVSARYLLPVLWGLAAGFRQDVGLMLAPLVIYCARFEILRSKRYATQFLALAALTVGLWFVPLVLKSEGLRYYLGAVRGTVSSVTPLSLALRGALSASLGLMMRNVMVVAVFLLIGAFGIIALRLMTNPPLHLSAFTQRTKFLLMWALPGFLLHGLTTIGHSGYVLPYLPPVLLLVGSRPEAAIVDPSRTRASPAWHVLVFGGAVALQVAFFLLVPQQKGILSRHWLTDTLFRSAILEPTRSRIEQYDATIEYLVAEIRRGYPREATLLIVPVAGELPNDLPVRPLFSQAKYYLPGWEQRVLYASPQEVLVRAGMTGPVIAAVTNDKFQLENTNVVMVPRNVRWLVWFCDVKTQPYRFDNSWVSYPVGPRVDLVMADMEKEMRREMRWGPFIFRHDGS